MFTRAELDRAVEVANQQGLNGRRVSVQVIQPASAGGQACYLIIDTTPRTPSES